MNRKLLFILVILIPGGLYIQGKHAEYSNYPEEIALSDTTYSNWIESVILEYNIPEPAIHIALNGYYDLKNKGKIKKDSLLVLVDFSKPSKEKRLHILDIKNEKVLRSTYVAHGMQSGLQMAESFSNRRLSNKSSLGLYVTKETYEGKHGYSLRIDGMSVGVNDNARKRAIVIHGADYVSEDFIKRNGRLGRSFGCPALPMDESTEIIDLIKDGTCLYIYHPSLIPISQESLEKLP